jgi:nucleotide-binding universal stress UspA family protein
MYRSILLAAALQRWERYSAYALAARDVAATLAGPAARLHVLTVYEYDPIRAPASRLPHEMTAKLREQQVEQTDSLMRQKLADYVAPLLLGSASVNQLLRVGSPRHTIVEVASEVEAELLVMGSHSKRGFLDIELGSTAHHVVAHAPCTVLMVAPKKT